MNKKLNRIIWPEGKKFGFSIFDDTDYVNLENTPPIYEFLYERGFRTTKSVWPIKGQQIPEIGGMTCEDAVYLKWVQKLQKQGFEIALHNVSHHTSNREQILKGLEKFKLYFGDYPAVHTNHADCQENIYWGESRVTGINRLIYNLLTLFKNRHWQGDIENSPLFWGDLSKNHIEYVRNFIFADINTLNACPFMPYYDQSRPYVNNWFASSEGPDVHSFNRTISENNQDRLEEEGGACIMYTHFASGFYEDNTLNPQFSQLMERLSQKSGWFVPVSTLLDHILKQRGPHVISSIERYKLEWRWLLHKIKIRGES